MRHAAEAQPALECAKKCPVFATSCKEHTMAFITIVVCCPIIGEFCWPTDEHRPFYSTHLACPTPPPALSIPPGGGGTVPWAMNNQK